LEGLLAVVGLEVTTKGVRTGAGTESWREREFQILGAATLKLREPNDVRTNGAERRLVLESLRRERVERVPVRRWYIYLPEFTSAVLKAFRVFEVCDRYSPDLHSRRFAVVRCRFEVRLQFAGQTHRRLVVRLYEPSHPHTQQRASHMTYIDL